MVWNVSILIRLIIYFSFVFIFVLIFVQCAQCTQRALGCWSKAHKRDTSSTIAAAHHLWAFQYKKQTNVKDSLYQHFTRKYCTNKWNIIFICKTISTMPLCAPTHQMSASSYEYSISQHLVYHEVDSSIAELRSPWLMCLPVILQFHLIIIFRTMTWRKRPRSVDISRAVAFWPPVFPGKPQAPIVSSSCVTLCSLSTAHITWPFSH